MERVIVFNYTIDPSMKLEPDGLRIRWLDKEQVWAAFTVCLRTMREIGLNAAWQPVVILRWLSLMVKSSVGIFFSSAKANSWIGSRLSFLPMP